MSDRLQKHGRERWLGLGAHIFRNYRKVHPSIHAFIHTRIAARVGVGIGVSQVTACQIIAPNLPRHRYFRRDQIYARGLICSATLPQT